MFYWIFKQSYKICPAALLAHRYSDSKKCIMNGILCGCGRQLGHPYNLATGDETIVMNDEHYT